MVNKESNKKSSVKTGYRMRYAGAHGGGIVVWLPKDPRTGTCEACGKSVSRGEIKITALHHWVYRYQPKTVKENPMLAVENTSELCFYCHQIADAIRMLLSSHPNRVGQVAELLNGESCAKFISVVNESLDRLKPKDNILARKLMGVK